MSTRAACILLFVALLAALFAVYWPALNGDYLFDDTWLIHGNKTLVDAAGLSAIWTNPASSPDYYPLTFTTWWLERRLFGDAVLPLHVTNLLLHALNSLLVWRVLLKLRVPGALLAALVFAFHPVHVESVAWMSERKDVLSGLFYLLAMLAFIRAQRDVPPLSIAPSLNTPSSSDNFLSLSFYALSLACFLCALLSKPFTMTLAAALLLILWRLHGRMRWDRLWLVIPFLLLIVPFILLTTFIQHDQVKATGPDFDLTLPQRIIIAARSLWFYAATTLWPADLCFAYPRWIISPADVFNWLAVVAAVLLAIAVVAARRRVGNGPMLALAWFAVTLSPALGFVNIYWHMYYYVADHVQYLACTGLIALAAAVITIALDRLIPSAAKLASHNRVFTHAVVALFLLVPLALVTANRAATYENSLTIWSDVVDHCPDSFLGRYNFGIALIDDARPEPAVTHFRAAIDLKPDFAMAHAQLGRALNGANRRDEAMIAWARAIELDSTGPAGQVARWNIANLRPGQLN